MRFLAFMAGGGLLTAGAYMAWPPAALIVSGVGLIAIACYGRTHERTERPSRQA